jgi:hypothetical protein
MERLFFGSLKIKIFQQKILKQALDDANQTKSKILKLVSISTFLSDFANAIMKSETDSDC